VRRCVSDADLTMDRNRRLCVCLPRRGARRRLLPAKPDFQRTRREFRGRSDAAARRRPSRSTATVKSCHLADICSRQALVPHDFLSSASTSLARHPPQLRLFRGAMASSPIFGDVMCAPAGSGGGRLAAWASEASVSRNRNRRARRRARAGAARPAAAWPTRCSARRGRSGCVAS